jgi:hypothetical protein
MRKIVIQAIAAYPLSEALGIPFPHASHSRNETACMIQEVVGIKMGRSSLGCYSLTGTQKELLWLGICPLLPLPFFHHLDEYIRKPVSTYEKVRGRRARYTHVLNGDGSRKGVSACCHIYSSLLTIFICTGSCFFLIY